MSRPAKLMTEGTDQEWREAEALYQNERNPLFAWFIFGRCLRANRPVPETVRAYFVKLAGGIIDLARKPASAQKVDKHAKAKALSRLLWGHHAGVRGRGTVFEQFRNEKRDEAVTLAIGRLMLRNEARPLSRKPLTRERMCELVGRKYGIQAETAAKIFNRLRSRYELAEERVGPVLSKKQQNAQAKMYRELRNRHKQRRVRSG